MRIPTSDPLYSATLINYEVVTLLGQLERLKAAAYKAIETDNLFFYKAIVDTIQTKKKQIRLKEELLDEILDLIPLKYFLR